jgi:hypothetical protein
MAVSPLTECYSAVNAGSDEYEQLNDKIPPPKKAGAAKTGLPFFAVGFWNVRFRR